MSKLGEILTFLISPRPEEGPLPLVDAEDQFDPRADGALATARSLNAAFLIAAAGAHHPRSAEAEEFLASNLDAAWRDVAEFYRDGLRLMKEEIDGLIAADTDFAARLEAFSGAVATPPEEELAEATWSLFFPEAVGVRGAEEARAQALQERRTIKIRSTNPMPLTDPGRQILFTVNLLLTLPPNEAPLADLGVSTALGERLDPVRREPQLFWYDHPVQIGVVPEANELLYGLEGLDRAAAFEKTRGTMSPESKLRCAMSTSTTHRGLQGVARQYVAEAVAEHGGLDHVALYLFTESDTQRLIDDTLAPAAQAFLQRSDAARFLEVFGVEGPYGRHHSFLRAIAPYWHVLVDPAVTATFKFDLDQVWPQEVLIRETARSAFEHFQNPLWGGTAVDVDGQQLELGAMAGRLVNEADIDASLFAPDVPYPRRPLGPDEFVFFSPLPQALSTAGEVAARYGGDRPDGTTTALERVHVHGGTAAIFVDSLRRHRPFTPSFIGRAEDQAFVLSTFGEPEPRLAYVHNDNLIQRHDKHAFAGEAIRAARIGTALGDYERILLFSEYGDVLAGSRRALKGVADPFTGCFISSAPITVTYLRFALKAASMFASADDDQAIEFITSGAKRLTETLTFVRGSPSELVRQHEREEEGWDVFYDTLTALERRLREEDPFAQELAGRARQIVAESSIT